MEIEPKTRAQLKAERKQKVQIEHLQIFLQFKNQPYFDQPQDQYDKLKYYSEINLKNPHYQYLHQLVSSTFHHARRRQNFFTIVDRHPDYTLRCVYSGDILSDSDGIFLQRCDEQHSFPQSYQRGSKAGTGRDMHAIFSAGKSANQSRGNIPFGNFGKLVEQDKNGKIFYAEQLKTYEPNLNVGALARATLYILVCYKNCANRNYLPKQCLKWLVDKASSTEVTLWQKHRNQVLYQLQRNRNPFIDYSYLAKLISFDEGWQKEQQK